MRHQRVKSTLGREIGPRKALMRSLAESIVLHEAITTTKAKAKALKRVIEPLVTKAKKNKAADKEAIMSVLYTGKAVHKLVAEIAPRYMERKGGYTRIIKIGNRPNDAAEKVRIEFV